MKMEELLHKVKDLEVKTLKNVDLDLVKQASDTLRQIYGELEQMKGNVVTIQIGSYIRYEQICRNDNRQTHSYANYTADPERHPLTHPQIE